MTPIVHVIGTYVVINVYNYTVFHRRAVYFYYSPLSASDIDHVSKSARKREKNVKIVHFSESYELEYYLAPSRVNPSLMKRQRRGEYNA